MPVLHLLRLIAFGVVIFFSIITFGISANLTHIFSGLFSFAPYTLAVSIITLIVVIPMLVIDFIRQGAVTSWVIVELIWVFILGILWLAAGGNDAGLGIIGCIGADGPAESACQQVQAIEAFSFLNWLILHFYFVGLLILSIVAMTRSNNVFMRPVTEADFFARNGQIPPAQPGMHMQQGSYMGKPADYPPQGTPAPGMEYQQQPVYSHPTGPV